MKATSKCFFALFLIAHFTQAQRRDQVILLDAGLLGKIIYKLGDATMPQYGFLPGKKFPTYDTRYPFDFQKRTISVTLQDMRDSLQMKRVNCSELDLKNKSEFRGEQGTLKVWQYLNHLLSTSNIVIDNAATDTLKVKLRVLDSRLFGFGQVEVHGICEMEFEFHGVSKIYCVDLEDGDPTAPLGWDSVVTRKTASRLITSASIRDLIEQFLNDFENWK